MTDWLDGSGRETAGASFFDGELAKANYDSDILPEENIPVFLFAIHQLHPDTLEPYAPYLSPERWHRARRLSPGGGSAALRGCRAVGQLLPVEAVRRPSHGTAEEPVRKALFGGKSRPV